MIKLESRIFRLSIVGLKCKFRDMKYYSLLLKYETFLLVDSSVLQGFLDTYEMLL